MSSDLYYQLDNPAWFALTGPQQSFSTGNGKVKRYKTNNLPFAAYDHQHKDQLPLLDQQLQSGEIFFLIGSIPTLPPNWIILAELTCLQMINHIPITPLPDAPEILPLGEGQKQDMIDLVQRVQPGYFAPDTYQLGDYYGIWQDGKLVAMAGERMRVNGMSELSAICTDPAYTGRKYAQHLIIKICNANHAKGIIPFLHVLDTNERAVKLYEFMGFETRRTISFWKLQKN
ncbi:GNAT family N-acetyltransferase [Pseudobacter ginsenosidimutans]|jgi:GNAT superfamily N-acetyltransferase|uniref:FR47-like protein n=1 Tax=Pseudobacter ginsenosidimutans TaxID=661488 RepID=A0A4Q7N486_9BACT|nr:GNAT family N-acetyltransferase [Pseudobacter ginsenosidimutans]QEC44346.1 GNAT family N-acetyltransferase [Pseudobacter ginsenosidimutans]RZS75812.1 FR47-like protein [Pseudobacter ginsenosidimutans]